MKTTVIFDLSEVYLRGLKGTEEILEPLLKIPVENIKEILLHGKHTSKFFHGEVNEKEFWRSVKDEGNWNISTKKLKEAVRKNFSEIEGTREIIEELKNKRYKMGLLSVHAKEWIDHLEKRFDYHKLFHSILYSFEVGVSKPDKKSYQLILEKLDAKPEECLFIDDHEKNIAAAKELGISTIHFKNSIQLKEELRRLNLL